MKLLRGVGKGRVPWFRPPSVVVGKAVRGSKGTVHVPPAAARFLRDKLQTAEDTLQGAYRQMGLWELGVKERVDVVPCIFVLEEM
jgi:hypothetical protein